VSTPKGKSHQFLLSANLNRNLIAEEIQFGDQWYMHIILQTSKTSGQINANLKGLSNFIQENILEDISSKY
jgi:hypothetical protein